MMGNILHGLYNGSIIPWERQETQNEALKKIVRKIEDEEQYFIGKLSTDDCKRFEELSRLQINLFSLEEENVFSYGFTLGFMLMMDVAEEAKLLTGK